MVCVLGIVEMFEIEFVHEAKPVIDVRFDLSVPSGLLDSMSSRLMVPLLMVGDWTPRG